MKNYIRSVALLLVLAVPCTYSTPAAAMPNACESAARIINSSPSWSPQYWLASVYFGTNC